MDSSKSELAKAKQVFFATFVATILLKIWAAAYFPMTGDEAFFYQWGVFPDIGYYDHPPMIGWLLYLLNSVSSHPLALRGITVLLWSLIALGLVDLLRRLQPASDITAWWLGNLFLVLPFSWALNFVTTDTPLILFSFASGYCFIRAQHSPRKIWLAACGVFLGLALLSKFFAALLAITYFIYMAGNHRRWSGLLLIAACATPFVALNLYYNATHCWNNVMFNVFNRNAQTVWSLQTVLLYVAMLAYLVTPWVFIRLLRTGNAFRLHGYCTVLFIAPFAIFLLLSMKKTVGLHWVLSFMPFVFLFIGLSCSASQIRRYFHWTLLWSAPHLLVLAFFIAAPVSIWQDHKLHDDVVFHKETKRIISTLRHELPENGLIMARAYTPAALLSYHAGEYWATFGEGRHHARQDDILVNFQEFSGKPIRIFDRKPIQLEELSPYFDSVSISSFMIEGIEFWYADGTNFNFERYRTQVLQNIAERYYQIPEFLPRWGCPFLERYKFDKAAGKAETLACMNTQST